VDGVSIGSGIFDGSGACVGSLITKETFSLERDQQITLRLVIPNLNLAPGVYYGGFSMLQGGSFLHFLDVVIGAPMFRIMPNDNMVVANWQANWGNIVISDARLEFQEQRRLS
jgi:hypothetical protein